jgi:hypothetical protein
MERTHFTPHTDARTLRRYAFGIVTVDWLVLMTMFNRA